MIGQVAVSHHGPDAGPLSRHLDLGQRKWIDVNEASRRLDVQPHEIDEVGPAREETAAWIARRFLDRCGRLGRPHVREWFHEKSFRWCIFTALKVDAHSGAGRP